MRTKDCSYSLALTGSVTLKLDNPALDLVSHYFLERACAQVL